MQDHYYSKKLKKYFSRRLDVLLYAHDGRGFGHVSRAVGIGLALRRLYPEKRVLLVTGCSDTKMLLGPAPLDWIKLPAYQTVLKDGVPEGQDGNAGFYKSVLGSLRGEMLAAMVKILKPRCVLVDHNPAGKKGELVQALQETAGEDTRWILGLRGVIGEEPGIWSKQAAEVYDAYYHGLVWYGERKILGDDPIHRIHNHFGSEPLAAGYVSRLIEMRGYLRSDSVPPVWTIALPWLGEHGHELLHGLRAAAAGIGPEQGGWHIYVPENEVQAVTASFEALSFCSIRPLSEKYFTSLLHSRAALVYGGYNSLIDVIGARIPSLIIVRATRDREQSFHLNQLQLSAAQQLHMLEETEVNGEVLAQAMKGLLETSSSAAAKIDVNGAETTSHFLNSFI